MGRFVALCCVLAGCALGSEARLGGDGSVDTGEPADAAHDARMIDAPPDACVPSDEICDYKDNNCNGQVDEGFVLGDACDGPDSDACKEGFVVCMNGGTGCSDMTTNNVEKCNGVDDDCQNGVDDTFAVGQACSVGLGACARTGQLICNTAQTGTTCNAVAGAPSAELCGNGVDEDCNGSDPACPANDIASGAIDISNGGTFTVDLTTLHDDNWAATTATLDCGDQGGRDAFYQFTLPAEEVVYYDSFASNFDTVIRVFNGACTSIGATLACADDACSTTRSQGAIDLAAGTYCLVIDQFSATTTAGAASFTFRRGGRAGIGLSAASGTVTGSTTGKANLSIASCEANSNQPEAAYFFLTCAGSHSVSASTCTGTAFDSVLYMRSGAATSSDFACSDDVSGCGSGGLQSKITGASLSGPNVNWIIVDGFGQTGNGNYALTYSVQ